MTDPVADPAPAPAPGIGAVEAVIGTFTKPSDTFGRLVARPTWWLPLVLGLLLGTLSYVVASPKIDLEGTIRAQIEKSGRAVPAGTVERQVAFWHKWSPVFTAGFAVAIVVVTFLVALVLWGGAKAMGAEARYSQVLAIWTHAALPNSIGALVSIPLFLKAADGSLSQTAVQGVLASNVGAFMDEGSPAALRTLGSSLDIFSFAVLFLLVLGFRRLPGLSKGAATAVPIVLWLVYVFVRVGWKAVTG